MTTFSGFPVSRKSSRRRVEVVNSPRFCSQRMATPTAQGIRDLILEKIGAEIKKQPGDFLYLPVAYSPPILRYEHHGKYGGFLIRTDSLRDIPARFCFIIA